MEKYDTRKLLAQRGFPLFMIFFGVLPACSIQYYESVCKESASAIITAYDEGYWSEDPTDFAAMAHTNFSFDRNGELLEFERIGTYGEVGDTVKIRFDPNNKNNIIVLEGSEKIRRNLLFGLCNVSVVCGLLALVCTAYEFFRILQEQKKGDEQA